MAGNVWRRHKWWWHVQYVGARATSTIPSFIRFLWTDRIRIGSERPVVYDAISTGGCLISFCVCRSDSEIGKGVKKYTATG